MIISVDKITNILKNEIKKEIKKTKKKPKLTAFLIGNDNDQLKSIRLKKQLAKELGVVFELIHLKTPPAFEKLIRLIKEKSSDPQTNAVIIEQPLPAHLATESIYQSIHLKKEIAGHLKKTPFYSPLGLAILTILKSLYSKAKKDNLFVNKKDLLFFKRLFHHKKVVLIGQDLNTTQPIGRVLTEFKINYFSLKAKTANPEIYFKQADLIISLLQEKIISPENIKPGVVLINVGFKKENNKIIGGYLEKEIKSIAGFYTPVNKSIIELETVCLYKNLLDALKLQ